MVRGNRARARAAAVKVMAKMALMDERFRASERAFLRDMMPPPADDAAIDRLLESVRDESLDSLTAEIRTYEDRFFIALRAYAMAHVDRDYDSREEKAFLRLITLLGIKSEDRKLIEETQQRDRHETDFEPNPRLEQLFVRSSFAPMAK